MTKRTPPTPTDSSSDEPTPVQPTDSTPPTDASDSTEQPAHAPNDEQPTNDVSPSTLKEDDIAAVADLLRCSRDDAAKHLARGRAYLREQLRAHFIGMRAELDEQIPETLKRVSPSGIVYEVLSEVTREEVPWLWPGRIPRGMLTILAGDVGQGKSYITLDVASRLSTGKAWPDGGNAPIGTTILLSAEDVPQYVIGPRLDLLGADSSRIVKIEAIRERGDKERGFNLGEDLERLETFIRDIGALFVVIDPVNSYFPQKRDSYSDVEVRAVLSPLARMAAKLGVAIVAVMHLNKDEEKKALNRIMGSTAYAAIARMILTTGSGDEGETRLFGALKCSVGPLPSTLSFKIDATGLLWEGVIDREMRRVLEGSVGEPDTKEAEMRAFIREVLRPGTKMQARELDKLAKEQGFSKGGTWQRAKQKEGVQSEQVPGVSPPVWVSFRE